MNYLVNGVSLFKNTYKKREDQLTAGLLYILGRYGHPLIGHLFEECDLPDYEPVIRTQITGVSGSRPDGEIVCTCDYRILIESKLVRNALSRPHDQQQLSNHLKDVHANGGTMLVYITPDNNCPAELQAYPEIFWYNWDTIFSRLQDFNIQDEVYIFLVTELKKLLFYPYDMHNDNKDEQEDDKSSNSSDWEDRVIVVGGRWAEDIALNYNFYACQSNRFFESAQYMAFYYDNRIKHLFKIIDLPIEDIDLRKIQEIASTDYFVVRDPNYSGTRKYFRLQLLHTFDPEIQNDCFTSEGRRYAFVRRQRYTSYTNIMSAQTTSQL